MAINYEELERELKAMKPRQRLYELVKREMQKRGNWKGKTRGVPMRKGYDERRSGFTIK